MAQIHAYKHSGKDVILFGIDHSVGRHGTNRMDDVQLIQLLINRYIDYREEVAKKQKSPENDNARVLDQSRRLISKLGIDGQCGPLTLAAILAAQRSLDKWRGVKVDGRIDAIQEGGQSEFQPGTYFYVPGVLNNKAAMVKIMHTQFNAMYLLSLPAEWSPNPPWDIFSLPEPLKSSLLRSSISRGISALNNIRGG
jgi:hypothetical protein